MRYGVYWRHCGDKQAHFLNVDMEMGLFVSEIKELKPSLKQVIVSDNNSIQGG
jgi:hypothetical protein